MDGHRDNPAGIRSRLGTGMGDGRSRRAGRYGPQAAIPVGRIAPQGLRATEDYP